MTARVIRTLHVEDDRVQQKVIAHHLRRLDGLTFDIACVRSESEAVAAFRQAPRDLVIIDYHLSEGNGLSCLRTLRQDDPIVPIIAVSGQATAEVTAQLLQSGADDYISKHDLHGEGLAHSVRLALARADAWRRRAAPAPDEQSQARAALLQVCRAFTAAAGEDFLRRLGEFDAAAREAGLTEDRLRHLFEAVAGELAAGCPADAQAVRRSLRPVLLELVFRLEERRAHAPAFTGGH
jgi:CheY-like chemotaxis protein